MLAELRQVGRQLLRLAAGFDPAVLPASDCAEIVRLVVRVEQLAAAIRLPAAGRATDTPLVWATDGSTSPAEWLARHTGRSVGAAYTELQTAALLPDLPEIADAARAGQLSVDQTVEIAAAAAVAPQATDQLLETAGNGSYDQLRKQARGVRLAARSSQQLEEERHRQRRVRLGTTDLGAFVLRAEGPSADRVRVEAALAPVAEALFWADQSSGCRRTHQQRMYDALMASMGIQCNPGGQPQLDSPTLISHRDDTNHVDRDGQHSPDASAVPMGVGKTETRQAGSTVPAAVPAIGMKRAVRVELAAILRGRLQPGDICDLGGTDPLTLDAVGNLLPGSRMNAVVLGEDGEVEAVARLGRRPTRAGAWEWLRGGPAPSGPLLAFTGIEVIVGVDASELPALGQHTGTFLAAVARHARPIEDLASKARRFGRHQLTALAWSQPICQVAGCNRTAVLETDHRVGWHIKPVSDLPNADRLCVYHHRLKTYRGYRLEPGSGPRRLLPPDPARPP